MRSVRLINAIAFTFLVMVTIFDTGAESQNRTKTVATMPTLDEVSPNQTESTGADQDITPFHKSALVMTLLVTLLLAVIGCGIYMVYQVFSEYR